MSYMLDVVIELENAVQNALDLSSSPPSSSKARAKAKARARAGGSSMYERKRSLRRIERALDSLEKLIGDIDPRVRVRDRDRSKNDDCDDDNDGADADDDDDDDDDAHRCSGCVLDERSLASLMKILIDIPREMLSDSICQRTATISASIAPRNQNYIRMSSSSQSTGVHTTIAGSGSGSLYNRICDTSTYIVLRYASMPLDVEYMDGLLDRIATMAANLEMNNNNKKMMTMMIHEGILRIVNTSLASSSASISNDTRNDGMYDHAHAGNGDDCNNRHALEDGEGINERDVGDADEDDDDHIRHGDLYNEDHIHGDNNNNEEEEEEEEVETMMKDFGQIVEGSHAEEEEKEYPQDDDPSGTTPSRTRTEEEPVLHQHISVQRMFSLDANETLYLIQLLIPLSLRHLSKRWIYKFMGRQDEDSEDEDEEHGDDDEQLGIMYGGMGIGMTTETMNDDDNDDNEGKRAPEGSSGTWTEILGQMQEGEIQLRILIGHLLKHFGCSRKGFLSARRDVGAVAGGGYDDDHNVGGSDGDNHEASSSSMHRRRDVVELDDMLHHIFQDRINEDCDDDDHEEDEDEREQQIQDMVEDSVDMMVSFLAENIEYVIDAVHDASQFFADYTDDYESMYTGGILMNQGGLPNDEGGSRKRNSMMDESIVYYTFKETIRHAFLVVGTIELFLDDLGVSRASFQSRAEELLGAFGNYVAMYCTDRFLVKMNIQENASTAIALAEKVLFQLYLHVSSNGRGGSSVHYRADVPFKRRRLVDDNRFPNMATTITILRSLHSSRSNNDDFGKSLLENELVNLGNFVTDAFQSDAYEHGNDEDGCNSDAGNTATYEDGLDSTSSMALPTMAAHEAMTLVQACTLADLILPCGVRKPGDGDENESKMALLSSLVSPQLDLDSMAEEDGISEATKSHLVDPMNPWNMIVARNLSSQLQFMDEEQMKCDDDSILPGKIITTASTSSVSDLRSDNASSDYGRSKDNDPAHYEEEEEEDDYALNRWIVTAYIEAVPPHANTIEGL